MAARNGASNGKNPEITPTEVPTCIRGRPVTPSVFLEWLGLELLPPSGVPVQIGARAWLLAAGVLSGNPMEAPAIGTSHIYAGPQSVFIYTHDYTITVFSTVIDLRNAGGYIPLV